MKQETVTRARSWLPAGGVAWARRWIAAAGITCAASSAGAITIQRDTSVALALDRARQVMAGTQSGVQGPTIALLRQAGGPLSAARLDSVANGITELIVGADSSSEQHGRLVNLVSVLVAAGGAADGGVPYAKVVDKLIQIARTARDRGVRQIAMMWIPEMPKREQGLQFLRNVAASPASPDDPVVPWIALGSLTVRADRDAELMNIVRNLWERKLVVDERAARGLKAFANFHGWR